MYIHGKEASRGIYLKKKNKYIRNIILDEKEYSTAFIIIFKREILMIWSKKAESMGIYLKYREGKNLRGKFIGKKEIQVKMMVCMYCITYVFQTKNRI